MDLKGKVKKKDERIVHLRIFFIPHSIFSFSDKTTQKKFKELKERKEKHLFNHVCVYENNDGKIK